MGLATVGYSAVSAGLHLPGPMYSGICPADAHNALISNGPMQQLLLWIGVFETLIGIPALKATMNGERAPGDYQFGMIFAPTDRALSYTKINERRKRTSQRSKTPIRRPLRRCARVSPCGWANLLCHVLLPRDSYA